MEWSRSGRRLLHPLDRKLRRKWNLRWHQIHKSGEQLHLGGEGVRQDRVGWVEVGWSEWGGVGGSDE